MTAASATKANLDLSFPAAGVTFNEVTEYMQDIPSPTETYAPDYIESEEAEERRLAFIERRPIDPAKNLPTLGIKLKAPATAAD